MIGRRRAMILRSLVPSLSAFSYWISCEGARKLLSRTGSPLGLADWPLQILKVRNAGASQDYFVHGGESNSTISSAEDDQAQARVSIFYRPLTNFFHYRSIKFLSLLIFEVGFFATFKAIILMRLFRRFARYLNRNISTDNLSVKIYL